MFVTTDIPSSFLPASLLPLSINVASDCWPSRQLMQLSAAKPQALPNRVYLEWKKPGLFIQVYSAEGGRLPPHRQFTTRQKVPRNEGTRAVSPTNQTTKQ